MDGFGNMSVGSNVFELIEFTLTREGHAHPLVEFQVHQESLLFEPTLFGVNVAKVREVIKIPHLEQSLSKKSAVLGVFQLRGQPIPVIHLAAALGISEEPLSERAQVLITEFSGRVTGFAVATARRIRRVSWADVIPPQENVMDGITGMMFDEKKRFIFIIDFEKVLADTENDHGMFNYHGQKKSVVHFVTDENHFDSDVPVVVVADDSATARKALTDILRRFPCNISECKDGEQALQMCLQLYQSQKSFMVISDIEMPRLDGYSLARRIRSDSRLSQTPFLLHSSLTGDSNKEKAMAAGADAFIGKLNQAEIVSAVEICLSALNRKFYRGLKAS